MESEKKYFASWWFWIGFLVIVSLPVFFGLRSLGLIGSTVVEREVFQRSFQYQEARKTAIATYEAQLVEIERKLLGELDQNTRNNFEAQAAAIRIQLATERSKQ
ncbi:MAG: hypothetical protein ACYS5F_15265 [Planctomycetota bacterium]